MVTIWGLIRAGVRLKLKHFGVAVGGLILLFAIRAYWVRYFVIIDIF
jgi:hypothetical protein